MNRFAVLLVLLCCAAPASAQQAPLGRVADMHPRVADIQAVAGMPDMRSSHAVMLPVELMPANALSAQEVRRRSSRTAIVIGALTGAAAGVLVACHFNRGTYDEFCLGQSDTKLAVGAVLGAAVGGTAGALLTRRPVH